MNLIKILQLQMGIDNKPIDNALLSQFGLIKPIAENDYQ